MDSLGHMSDTYGADSSAAGEIGSVSDGLDAGSTFASDTTSTPSEAVDASLDGSTQESAAPVDALFEVDGTGITLDEARNGYLRQSDYTRKTQELAMERARLAEAEALVAALQNDPSATLTALQEAFSVESNSDPYAELDPDQARIAALEAKVEAQERAATQAAIEAELDVLHEQFGEFDDSILFAHAIKGGFPNLKAAYADMNFGTLQAQLEQLSKKQQEEEQRIAAKRQAANTVHNGASRAGATAPAGQEKFDSLRDAFLAAKKSLGA